jgi:ribosomal protein S18 acetylase RimI-like enzyme
MKIQPCSTCSTDTIRKFLAQAATQRIAQLGFEAKAQFHPTPLPETVLFSGPGQSKVLFAHRPWDSRVLDIPTGALGPLKMDPSLSTKNKTDVASSLIAAAAGHAFSNGIELLTCRNVDSEIEISFALETNGFFPLDTLSSLTCSLPQNPQQKSSKITLYEPSDLPEIQAFADAAFSDSHFLADPKIPIQKAQRLFSQWVNNNCNGRADLVLTARQNGYISGFIAGVFDKKTEAITGHRVGHIDLVAVAPEVRNQGIGRALVEASMAEFASQGVRYMTVATQKQNVEAFNLYLNCGFLPQFSETTYHAWRN